MKSKFISLLTAGMISLFFAACSDDSSSGTVLEPIADDEENVESSAAAEAEGEGSENEPNTSSTSTETSSAAGTNVAKTYKYYGAELTGKEHFTYGKFEAKMKMVAFPGTVSSMFTYYDPSYLLKEEPWNEIDIEVLGKNPEQWQSNLITREPNATGRDNGKQYSETLHKIDDVTKNFHVYTIIWTPEYIAWEIDGEEIRRNTVGDEHKTAHDQVAFMTETQSLRFNLWAAKDAGWVGKFTGEELANGPAVQEIDYVKVYSYDKDTKKFTELWTDDFEGDALDPKHWSKGDWEMERVMYRAQNVVVENGVCKLIMDREEVAE